MADDAVLPRDLAGGFRFVHRMGEETRREVFETAMTVLALVEELREQCLVDGAAMDARIPALEAADAERTKGHLRVKLNQDVDKYHLVGPDIPCDELIPLCRGRCCTLHFPLSSQDLDERVVKWNYLQPYVIRQRADDRYCVHNDPTTRGCTIYHHRPAVCRTYDCRNDKRIWVDYEKRIPTTDPNLEPRDAPVPLGPPPGEGAGPLAETPDPT